MKLAAFGGLFATICWAQVSPLATELNFEAEQSGKSPKGWMTFPQGSVALDSEIVHSGKWAVRFERDAKTEEGFSNLMRILPMEFEGKTIELRGYLRTEDVS